MATPRENREVNTDTRSWEKIQADRWPGSWRGKSGTFGYQRVTNTFDSDSFPWWRPTCICDDSFFLFLLLRTSVIWSRILNDYLNESSFPKRTKKFLIESRFFLIKPLCFNYFRVWTTSVSSKVSSLNLIYLLFGRLYITYSYFIAILQKITRDPLQLTRRSLEKWNESRFSFEGVVRILPLPSLSPQFISSYIYIVRFNSLIGSVTAALNRDGIVDRHQPRINASLPPPIINSSAALWIPPPSSTALQLP